MSSRPTFMQLAARDSAIVAVTVLLWFYLAPWSTGSGALGDFTGVVTGAALALCAHLVHEWGHVLGGLAGRSRMQPGVSLKTLSLFVYSSTGNSRRQFMLMSFSGFAATALVVWFCYGLLPDDRLATRIARGYSMVQVFLALVIELPLVIWALLGKSLPPIDKVAASR